MFAGHPQIVLFQPEIPQNTGNIARLAAATGCRLHLILPLGFSTEDKNLRRPGLDYWPFLDMEIHDSIEPLLEEFEGRFAFFSKKSETAYSQMKPEIELLIFGRETTGLPPDFHDKYAESFYQIPMFHEGVRSLNLSNAVAITTYHQMSQRDLF